MPRATDAENAFVIRGRTTVGDGYVFASTILKDGHFSLDVPYQGDGWYVLVETPERIASLHGPITVGKGEIKSAELVPRTGGRLDGFVTNHSSVAVPLFAVLFSRLGIQYETRVKPDGAFELANVYPGIYGLKVGSDVILDTELPEFDEGMTLEEQLEIGLRPSQPWRRAIRVIVKEGEDLNGIAVDFEP